jgi:acetyltransferase-like isoleucine patch superfamily enzyme
MLASRFSQYQIGHGSYGGLSIVDFGEGAVLSIGAYCSFASGVQVLLGGEHRADWVTTYPFSALDQRFSAIKGHPRTRGNVVIGNDVWVGREAMILSGVTIGDGAVIGARAVVAKDVPAYGVVAGSPAVLIRHRFPPNIVQRLLAVAWWTWPVESVNAAVPLLLAQDIEGFLQYAERNGPQASAPAVR